MKHPIYLSGSDIAKLRKFLARAQFSYRLSVCNGRRGNIERKFGGLADELQKDADECAILRKTIEDTYNELKALNLVD